MELHLRLYPGQQALTPAQEAGAQRFAAERIAAQLSTEPIDEPETEHLLRQAYAVVGFPPPEPILWLDGPLELLARAGLPIPEEANIYRMDWTSPGWHLLPDDVQDAIGYRFWEPDDFWRRLLDVKRRSSAGVEASLWIQIRDHVWENVADSVEDHIATSIQASVEEWVEAGMWAILPDRLRGPMQAALRENAFERIIDGLWVFTNECVMAYEKASDFACYRFLDGYLAPNEMHALAHFNERVSGYWLGNQGAVLVRRPRVLALDHGGRLHSATGKCVEYRDGWGFYAWHGVRVPDKVILTPERLTREDFLKESNPEIRRVIQERMGDRFVSELGGKVIDTSPRGTLYEVEMPAPATERVARYVQVQDASTQRQYFLQVPPRITSAAEAVAWSFGLPVEDYGPAQET